MAIQGSELKLYKSTVINDISTNGGRISSAEVVDGVLHNVFPKTTESERISGVTKHRKLGLKVANDADTEGSTFHLCLDKITPLSGRVVIFQSANNSRDTQGDLTGSERLYGVGELNADVSAAGTSLVVNCETGSGADLVFQVGDTVYISDGTNEEYKTIDTGGISWTGDQVTITLSAGLDNAYAAATPTVVAACIDQATVKTIIDNWVETSTSGTYDETTYPVAGDNIGTVEETWTLTFTDATNFGVVGDTVGSVGTGTTGGDFSPNNADFTKPYFTLLAAGFAGTWANGETIVFQTHMASVDFWAKKITPAGATSGTDDNSYRAYIES